MLKIDDIIKRTRYVNNSFTDYEYNKFHNKVKNLYESDIYNFYNIKFILQHWQCLDENQNECFKYIINILDESYNNDLLKDFNYIKSYIINEVAPTVRDSKQSARYLRYKTTRMKNKIAGNIKRNTQDIKDNTKRALDNIKDNTSKSVSVLKNNAKKSLGKKDIHEAYVQILDELDKYTHCDRILENASTIQKRFNLFNMIENTNINNNAELNALVDSICECVNTYDSDFSTRFNTVLETCFYFLSKYDKNFNKSLVLEETINNFISKEFTETKLFEMKSLLESSVIYSAEDKNDVEWIYNAIPFEENAELAKPFLKSNNSYIEDLGTTISNISNDMTDRDVKKILSIIRKLFEVKGGEFLALCIDDINKLLKKMSSLYTGDNFGKICYDELERVKKKRDNRSIPGYNAQGKYCQILEKYAKNNAVSEFTLIADLNQYNESFDRINKTAKDIVNDFKVAKMKRSTDIRTCISKMFTKSPDQIIDGTPNFLSWLRLSYVVGATSINPVLGGITLLVDQFIAMRLKRRDINKMITAFNNEIKNVNEKLKRSVDEQDKRNLKAYKEYLSNNINKLEEYRDSLLTDHELDALQNKEDYDKKDELEFLKDDDINESTSFENLVLRSNLFSKEYFTNNIRKNIDIMDEDTIDVITDIACKYPSIISTSGMYSILQEELMNIKNNKVYNNRWTRMSCLNSNIRKLDPDSFDYVITSNDADKDIFDIINGLEDLFVEFNIIKYSPKNESMSSSVKLLSNKLKKLMQKASDINKESSRKIDSSVNLFISGMQRAARNDNREAIIRGSIMPSASKIVKAAILDAGVALVNPAIAVILAVGQFAISKKMKHRERQFVLDEIDIEIEMCKRYLRQAEDQNDLEAQKKILRIQRNLERQKQRIEYNMKVHWKQELPNTVKDDE